MHNISQEKLLVDSRKNEEDARHSAYNRQVLCSPRGPTTMILTRSSQDRWRHSGKGDIFWHLYKWELKKYY